jgi:hypothetical protein
MLPTYEVAWTLVNCLPCGWGKESINSLLICELCNRINYKNNSAKYQISEIIFKTKNTFHYLIKRNAQCFYHKSRLIKLVP